MSDRRIKPDRQARNELSSSMASVFVLLILLYSPFALAEEYRIGQCLYGCPEGASRENHLLLRPIYALSYNSSNKAADWAAYRVTAGSIGIASSLSRQPVLDNFVEDTLQPVDFAGSEELGLVRSHLVPLVDFAGTPYWNDVNFLSNAVARSRSLSQGAWYGLEWSIRNFVNRGNEVFIITGPIYKELQTVPQLQTETQHRVPDAFFKIVMTDNGRGSAFVFDQSTPVHVHHCDLQTTVEEIEALTDLNIFPENPRLNLDSLGESLGCR
ncbi:MAG: hypothetical protein COA96_03990 [SAR86 cluster bacterium]|uniref:DNA/RNA non-specific endonuclease n=1 Tax=SAR86 cluster bacterium TaxID=2030880 RepID=A0A2A5B6B2_9GAMM|nr:MAG: hypothetical protein COA96_03990 [SAR86 cluster bacterium]